MAGGYQVDAAELANGSRQIQALVEEAQSVASGLASTFAALMNSAENAQLSSALESADSTCTARMLDVGTVLTHIGDSLADNARSYQNTEEQNTAKIRSAVPGAAR